MTFPTVADKYLDASVYPPTVFLEALLGTGWTAGVVPESIVMTYAHMELYLATRPDLYTPNHMLGTGPGRFYIVNGTDDRVGINCLGIGAPAAVAQMELQVELGAKRFISIGLAGGFLPFMNPGDLILATDAVRDEGTSFHYLEPDVRAVPHAGLNDAYGSALDAAGLKPVWGTTLTTDAPHRTTAREIDKMREDGVLTVEMEASAIFAAGAAMGVETASALVVDGVAGDDYAFRLDLAAATAKLQALFAATVSFLGDLD